MMKKYTPEQTQVGQYPPVRQWGDAKASVRIIPLGGAANVTKNMYVYEFRRDRKLIDILIVDCGIGFPEPDMYGVDVLIPDVRYLLDKKRYIRGLVFTHGHDDHIGGLAHILPKLGAVPMYGTKLTAAFANLKLRETGQNERVQAVPFGESRTFGNFSVTFLRITHSIPDTAHVLIRTPVGNFYHGSDFKFDLTPLDGKVPDTEGIRQAGDSGVLCMLSDCLGSERKGFTPSEQVVADVLRRECAGNSGKILFSVIASNVSRIQLAISIALEYRRQVAFLGRSIDKNTEEATRLGYMHVPRESIVRDRDLKRLPAGRQFLIVAGSQGQPESALARIANDEHRFVRIQEGDRVLLSSDPIPGNETQVNALIDQLFRRGATVGYTSIEEGLHVSGHGSQGDLVKLIQLVRPKYLYPIGGSYRHLMQYRVLAMQNGYRKNHVLIPESGEITEFRSSMEPKITGRIELEQVMVDGFGVGDIGNVVLRDRQTIATEGIVVVIVPIDSQSGSVTAEPDIVTRGFVYVRESAELIAAAKRMVISSLKLKKGKLLDWQYVRKRIEGSVGKLLHDETGRNPLIVPVIIEV